MSDFQNAIDQHAEVCNRLASIEKEIEIAISLCTNAIKQNRKLFVCGNGGSASDSQHLVAEIKNLNFTIK